MDERLLARDDTCMEEEDGYSLTVQAFISDTSGAALETSFKLPI